MSLLSVSLRQGYQDSFQFSSFGGRYAEGEFGSPFVRIHFNSITYSLALYNKFIQHRSTAVPRSELLPLDIASPSPFPPPRSIVGWTPYKEVDTHILFDNTIISKYCTLHGYVHMHVLISTRVQVVRPVPFWQHWCTLNGSLKRYYTEI